MNAISLSAKTQAIKDYAINTLGFSYVGSAEAEFLEVDAVHYEKWLSLGYQSGMDYMSQNIEKRLDPRLLVPGAKTVLTLLHNYYSTEKCAHEDVNISKYAYGRDYHKVIKKKLKKLLSYIQAQMGDVQGRGFVDSAPVMERSWAKKSGLGWVGKNSMLINKKNGSFFFISTLILDCTLEYDLPFQVDHCGTCTRCIDACPTQAIVDSKVIDSNKCISYLTIELKEKLISENLKFGNWIFGCDVCQDVCPWNRFSIPHSESDFDIRDSIKYFNSEEILGISEDVFNSRFEGSPLRRAGFEGLLRNIKHVKKGHLR